MRGSIPIELSIHEKNQMKTWLSSEPSNSKLVRNSQIILDLAEGKTITLVAGEQNVCRQTVSKVYHRFNVFRLEGIKTEAPRLGRKPTINSNKAGEVLCTPLYASPQNSLQWSVRELAKECNLPISTTYRFLRLKDVSLDNPKTIHTAMDVSDPYVLGIAGFLTSPLVFIIVFSCEARKESVSAKIPYRTIIYNEENVQAFFSRKSDQFLRVIDKLNEEFLSFKPKSNTRMNFLIFLKLIAESVEEGNEMLIIACNLDMVVGDRIAKWLERYPRYHLIDLLGYEQWAQCLRRRLDSVSERNKMRIAMQLEHLVVEITNWMEGGHMKHGVFASLNPLQLRMPNRISSSPL